jgi:hypothetical protein
VIAHVQRFQQKFAGAGRGAVMFRFRTKIDLFHFGFASAGFRTQFDFSGVLRQSPVESVVRGLRYNVLSVRDGALWTMHLMGRALDLSLKRIAVVIL